MGGILKNGLTKMFGEDPLEEILYFLEQAPWPLTLTQTFEKVT